MSISNNRSYRHMTVIRTASNKSKSSNKSGLYKFLTSRLYTPVDWLSSEVTYHRENPSTYFTSTKLRQHNKRYTAQTINLTYFDHSKNQVYCCSICSIITMLCYIIQKRYELAIDTFRKYVFILFILSLVK